MSESNLRQYKLMSECISLFNKDQLGIGELISKLDGLLRILENPDVDWCRRFQHEWGVLEDIYAYALYEKEANLADFDVAMNKTDNKNLIKKTIINIQKLLNEKIDA